MDFIQQVKPLISWLHLHPGFAGILTFFISFAESIAILGLLVPGAIIMSAIGTLVGAGIIPAYETMAWAALGAIVGDVISFKVGYRYTDHVKEMWPFRRYPQIIRGAEDFFTRHGGKSVFLGRFVGPMRPIIPIVAGMMQMNKFRFYCSCVIAGILWAPIYMAPGLLIGAASQQLAPETATRFVITVLTLLVIFWLTAWFFKWLIARFINFIDKSMDKVWRYSKTHKHFHWVCKALQDPLQPNGHGQLTLALIALVLIALLVWLYFSIPSSGILTILNQPVYQFFRSLHTATASKVMIIFTFFGYKYVIGFMSMCVFTWLLLKKNFRAAIHWGFVSGAVVVIVGISKHLIYSPRPSGINYPVDSNSFPSGHSALSVAIYGFMAFLIARNFTKTSQRKYVYGFFSTLCLLIMISRLYLGAHWLTDVVTSAILSLTIVIVTVISFRRVKSVKVKLPGFILVAVLSLAAGFPWQLTHNYAELNQIYTPYWPTYQASLNTWWHQNTTNPPLYRPNRLGRPVEIMNIQWVGQLDDIQTRLIGTGWKTAPKMTLVELVNRIASGDEEKELPIFSPLYLGQKPAFTAIKYSSENHIMILRLWASNVQFSDSDLPLWVGTITYQVTRHHKLWLPQKYMKKLMKLDTPIDELIPFLKGYRYHKLYYSKDRKPKKVPHYQWHGGVLFIMPNDVKTK